MDCISFFGGCADSILVTLECNVAIGRPKNAFAINKQCPIIRKEDAF